MNRFGRADVGAGSALGADAGIDLVNVSCGDRFNRTFVDTSTACGAGIFADFVSHFLLF